MNFKVLFFISSIFCVTHLAKAQEINANFPGGHEAMVAFFKNNFDQKILSSEDTTGRVYIEFVLDTLGQAQNVQVVKSLTPKIDEEVVRLIQLMPRWTPRSLNGKPIETIISLPFEYPFSHDNSKD